MRTLNDYLAFIEKAHVKEIDMGLSRVQDVYDALHLDFSNTRFVTVAGTNGKGTTCRFIEQACLGANLSVGVYSSPHIERFNERIRINGQDASDARLCEGFSEVKNCAEKLDAGNGISLTYFEYATLCALATFARSKLDVCILEVGLGGRLDATNIIDADIAVVTSIGLDHQDYLGNTLEQIASEKAGIIKAQQSVVIGFSSVQESLLAIAKQQSSNLLIRGIDFNQESDDKAWFRNNKECNELKHISHYQFDLREALIPQQNVLTAIATLQLLASLIEPVRPNSTLVLRNAQYLQELVSRVSMPGRFQIVSSRPTVILDVAHNEQACELLVNKLEKFALTLSEQKDPDKSQDTMRFHIVIGMLKDKNIEVCLQVMSTLPAFWYCVDLPTSRGEKAQRLSTHLNHLQQQAMSSQKTNDTNDESDEGKASAIITINSFGSVNEAFEQAKAKAGLNDVILLVGSFILASEFLLNKSNIEVIS